RTCRLGPTAWAVRKLMCSACAKFERSSMLSFNLPEEQEFNARRHVEKVLGRVADGDVTVACWEPGQISPYHCHPQATEIYFCFEGGRKMRTPTRTIVVVPGSFLVHPPGELREYIHGPGGTIQFILRYG